MNIDAAILILEVGSAITMVSFGIHQLINPKEWLKFMPPWMIKYSPLKPETEMRIHALGNILFGLFLVLNFGLALCAAWIAFVWWLSIVPFAWRVDWALGLRDLNISLALAALIFLQSF